MKATYKWVKYLLEDGTRSRERVLVFEGDKPTAFPRETKMIMPSCVNNDNLDCNCTACLYNKHWEVKNKHNGKKD